MGVDYTSLRTGKGQILKNKHNEQICIFTNCNYPVILSHPLFCGLSPHLCSEPYFLWINLYYPEQWYKCEMYSSGDE